MAKSNSSNSRTNDTPSNPGSADELRARLFHERYWWFDKYRGTKDELIAAGLLRDGMFPGDPGMGKTMTTHKARNTEPRLQVSRQNKRIFVLRVICDDAERERRRDADAAQEAAEAARAQERVELDGLPVSSDDFRKRAVHFLRGMHAIEVKWVTKFAKGYRFNRAAFDEYEETITEAIEELASAPVCFNRDERAAFVAEIKQQTAQADPGYQSMLATIVAGAASAEATDCARGEA